MTPGGTDQLPMMCQPLLRPPLSFAFIQVFCVPANEELNVRARFNVKLLPDPETEELPTFTLHWLFCKVPAAPSVIGPSQLVTLSFSRYRLFAERTYRRKQELKLPPLGVNWAPSVFK